MRSRRILRKECLVTTGATAGFPELIRAALSPISLDAFRQNNFTHITFQCGDCLASFDEWKPEDPKGLVLTAFDFNSAGLNQEMRRCQAKERSSERGLVISHAGTGTVLDTMRLGLALIVVPNESLLDNHQEELAVELEKQGYATMSYVGYLPQAIHISCYKEAKAWASNHASLAPIIDDVIGYEHDTRARLD